MKVRIPALLYSYTGGVSDIDIEGSTVAEILQKLDQRYPGIKFRFVDEHGNIRQHMKIYINGKIITSTSIPVSGKDEMFIIQALSGG